MKQIVKLVQRVKGGQAEAPAEMVFTTRDLVAQPTALKWPRHPNLRKRPAGRYSGQSQSPP
jgi:hypothetical protein